MEDNHVKKKITSRFVRKKTLRATLQAVSQQMYIRNKELADTNRMLSLLRSIDMLALESHENTKIVSQQLTDLVEDMTDYPLVALFSSEVSHKGYLSLFGLSVTGYRASAGKIEFEEPPRIRTDSPLLISEQVSGVSNIGNHDIAAIAKETGSDAAGIKSVFKQAAVRSVYTYKLTVRQKMVGIFIIGFSVPAEEVAATEVNLLDRLAESIGIALDNKLLFEENQYVLAQLKRSNAKLKALDETKDEFISMASHQLRTPLTSVKGYLSMVLEGDAGKLTDTQYKLVDQAYTSSQRMVYLIADLLNLSRLRTGKFVIDLSPVNMAELIHGEIEQLRETAAARDIKITYHQPSQFPILQLDMTKIQQVLMNLIDNAIYYTPPGGKVEIRLKKLPGEIEFIVKDSGIGVPDAERHHLFTKFYRAANAKKQRPDGTGIGLYMAKKVIVAHGGSIVFDSKEGKGSTFGFKLPLKN